MDAGGRFELPMHLAYETGVVAALPAQLFILGVPGWIQTSGFRDLQSLALGHSATETFPYM